VASAPVVTAEALGTTTIAAPSTSLLPSILFLSPLAATSRYSVRALDTALADYENSRPWLATVVRPELPDQAWRTDALDAWLDKLAL
jgi:hypothetical protein